MADRNTSTAASSCDDDMIDMNQKTSSELNTRSGLTVLGAFLAIFCTIGFLNSFGMFLEWYHEHELSHRSTFDITWIGSFSTFMFFVSALPAGLLVDRFGPTILLIFGGVVTLFSMFIISFCKEYYQFFLAQGILLGVGQASLTTPAFTMINRSFDRHRGLASGFVIAGSSLGGIIWPIVTNELLNKDGIGFPWTMRIVAFAMLPLICIACVCIRQPASRGCGGDEASIAEVSKKLKKKTDISIIKNPVYLTFVAGLGVYYLGTSSPPFFVTSYAIDIGMSTSFAFYLVSTLNAGSLIGRILGGWCADRYGCFSLCAVAAIVSAIITFCWTSVDSAAGLMIWSLAYGFASGSITTYQSQCTAKLATPATYGTATGMTFGIVSFTGLFGSPIAGELIKYGYLALSLYAGATLAVGGLLILGARFQMSRKLYKKV